MTRLNWAMRKSLTNNSRRMNSMKREKREKKLKDKNNKSGKKENKMKLVKKVLMNSSKMLIVMDNPFKIMEPLMRM
jgi:hypothetical protein